MVLRPSWETASCVAIQEFPTFYGTRMFITVFTRTLQCSLFLVRSLLSIPPHTITVGSILILSTHLRLGFPCGLFPSGFPTNILYAFLFSQFVLHVRPISSLSLFLATSRSYEAPHLSSAQIFPQHPVLTHSRSLFCLYDEIRNITKMGKLAHSCRLFCSCALYSI
jgi:hypothetical protein